MFRVSGCAAAEFDSADVGRIDRPRAREPALLPLNESVLFSRVAVEVQEKLTVVLLSVPV